MDFFKEKKIDLDNMYTKMFQLEEEILNLKKKITIAEKALETSCPQHEFLMKDNGDYHSPGYNYICKHCKYFTNIRPQVYSNR